MFKNDRPQFEEKWDSLKLFIQYGMLSDEKFYDRGAKFALLKDVDGKYYTFEEYKALVSFLNISSRRSATFFVI